MSGGRRAATTRRRPDVIRQAGGAVVLHSPAGAIVTVDPDVARALTARGYIVREAGRHAASTAG